VAAARILVQVRLRAELRRAQIREAYLAASQVKSETDAARRREQRIRRDKFFWKRATTANTLESYHDYLREFPRGGYSAQARKRIQALSQPEAETNTNK
jgi:hypothetical protein